MAAGTKSPAAIFVSRNRGASWTELEGFRSARRWYWRSPAEPPFSAYVQAIGLSPVDPQVIIAILSHLGLPTSPTATKPARASYVFFDPLDELYPIDA